MVSVVPQDILKDTASRAQPSSPASQQVALCLVMALSVWQKTLPLRMQAPQPRFDDHLMFPLVPADSRRNEEAVTAAMPVATITIRFLIYIIG